MNPRREHVHVFFTTFICDPQDQVESIDEYLVPLELLELLASMAGMELVASFNFADFFSTMLQHSDRSKRAR